MICSDINLPKYIRKEKRALTQTEKEALSTADFANRKKAFLFIIYYCGLRRGEALALSQFDFSFQKGKRAVSVTKIVIFDRNTPEIKPMPKTDHGFRTVPLSDAAAGFLKEYISGINGVQLFTCQDGSLTAHIFRHNYCTNLCYKVPEISIKKITQLMGDTEKMVMDVYNHVIDEKEYVFGAIESALAIYIS